MQLNLPNPGYSSTFPVQTLSLNKPVTTGIQLEVQPQTAFIFTIARSFGDNWEGELMLGFPPVHEVKMRVNNQQIKGLASAPLPAVPVVTSGDDPTNYVSAVAAKHIASYDGEKVAKLKQFAPTVFINYRFGTPQSTWRPYVGVGVNFTHVKPEPTASGEAFYNDGKVKTKVSDSWGQALQVGLSYHIDETWLINASYATAQVANNIEIQTASGATQYGKYKFNPSIWMLTVGRKF